MQGDWVAIDAGADRRAAAKRLARIHEQVTGTGDDPADDGRLRDPIADSWRRSSEAGVDSVKTLAPRQLSHEKVRGIWESSPLRVARPVLEHLLEEVGTAGSQVALICDSEGRLLWIDGQPGVVDRAQEIHLELGAMWAEDVAGTNAMGTALALRHPIQVFSAEHFSAQVHGWTCSAAPIRDPETGEQLGVIDLSGELKTAHPHSLALVGMAARMVEAELAASRAVGHRQLIERFGHRIHDSRAAAHGLLSPKGTVLSTRRKEWRERRVDVPARGGVIDIDGTLVMAEPLDGGGFLIWPTGGAAATAAEPRPGLRLEALGADRARVLGGGARPQKLSRRHSEILTLLALRPAGLSAEQIALEVYGDFGKPVSARAELSRLRAALGVEMEANPYRLTPPAGADFLEARALIDAGRLGDALDLYKGPLLPGSEVPAIAEARAGLESAVREAVLGSDDPAPLHRWLQSEGGSDDLEAARRLASMLDRSDPRRSEALGRLRRLSSAG